MQMEKDYQYGPVSLERGRTMPEQYNQKEAYSYSNRGQPAL